MQNLPLTMLLGLILSATVTLPSVSAATTSLDPNDAWFNVLNGDQLQPGDVVELAGGVYRDPRRLTLRHRGTSDRPIVIRSRPGETPVFHRPDDSQNTMNLEAAAYLVLQGIEITGGAAGIRIGPGAVTAGSERSDQEVKGIQIIECHLHHLGGVAITCNTPGGTYRDCVFRRNHIHHTAGHGEAFYLGGNDASATFHDGLIEQNYIHHLNGPHVSQGDGIEIKDGSSGNRIIANVIHDTNYPGIIVYGSGGGPVNQIERNLIFRCGDHGIQAAADAVVRNNTIAMATHAGIYSRRHQSAAPGNLLIDRNVIVQTGDAAIRIINEATDALSKDSSTRLIRIVDNQLHPRTAAAISVKSVEQTVVDHNRGRGSRDPATVDSNWQETDLIDWTLPRDDGHPAWKHLDRKALRERLFAK